MKTSIQLNRILTVVLLFVCSISFGQFKIISGKVIDAEKKPIAFANVYIQNSTLGMQTNEKGEFSLKIPVHLSDELTVSSVGYITRKIDIRSNNNQNLSIELKAQVLKEVTVVAKKDQFWYEKWRKFQEAILGNNWASKQCLIKNPEVVRFSSDEDYNFIAKANEPLIIENNALGYVLKVELNQLKIINDTVYISAQKYFKEMQSSNDKQLKLWNKNRDKAFKDSFRNYLCEMAKKDLKTRKFETYQLLVPHLHSLQYFEIKENIKNNKISKFDNLPNLVSNTATQDFTLFSDKTLLIFSDKGYETARIEIPYHRFSFTDNGWLTQANSIILQGAWAEEGMANLLPIDFSNSTTQNLAQSEIKQDSLQPIPRQEIVVKEVSDSLKLLPRPERIFFQVDKPYYIAGQAIHLAAKVLDGDNLQATALSTPLYVEWIDLKAGKLLERQILKIQNGNVSLSLRTSDKLSSGYYQLRLYTNWMRNFYIPTQDILVLGLNYAKEISTTTVDTTITYFPQNPSLVANLLNRIVISVKNSYQMPLTTTAYLINSKKDTLFNFKTDTQGIGIAEFTPKLDEKYTISVGSNTYELPAIVSEGNILLNNVQKDAMGEALLKVWIQNTKNTGNDSLNLVVHQRGKLLKYFRIATTKPTIQLVLDNDYLQPGIVNIALLDAKKQVLIEQMLYVDSPNTMKQALLDAEVGESIDSLSSPLLIYRKLQTLHNQLYSLVRPTKTDFAPEQGLELIGQVTLNKKTKPEEVFVSLFLENGNKNDRQMKIVPITADGHFKFSNLEYYNKVQATLIATYKKEQLPIYIDSLEIPEIKAENRAIDWSFLQKEEKKAEVEKVRYATFEEIKKIDLQKTIELNALTVKAVSKEKAAMLAFNNQPPTQTILREQIQQYLGSAGSGIIKGGYDMFYEQYIYPRLQKYQPYPQLQFFVDGTRISTEALPDFWATLNVQSIDIYDGLTYGMGADLVVNITSRISEKENSKNFTLILNGFKK